MKRDWNDVGEGRHAKNWERGGWLGGRTSRCPEPQESVWIHDGRKDGKRSHREARVPHLGLAHYGNPE